VGVPELRVDTAVLDGFRQGEPRAFEAVVRAYLGTVRAVVSRFFSRPFMQEEAMQEVWTHVYRQRVALDPERYDQVAAWLAVLARRKCIDLLRQQGRSPALVDAAADLQADRGFDPPEQVASVERSELLAAVAAFKRKLRPGWRAFFELHFEQGFGYPEVAERLGIGRIRCKYMKRVLVGRAKRNRALMGVLGRTEGEVTDASEN
jgi:RNA polymerase sigma factor (sigma-70 family)